MYIIIYLISILYFLVLYKPSINHSDRDSEREQQLQMSSELSGKSLLNQKNLKAHRQRLLDRKRKAATSPSIGTYVCVLYIIYVAIHT